MRYNAENKEGGLNMLKNTRKHSQAMFGLMSALGLVSTSIAFVGGCQTAPSNGARMYEGFGNYARQITTDSHKSQQWFNPRHATDVRVQPRRSDPIL